MLLCETLHWSFAVALGTRSVISSKIKGCERGSRAGQRADDRLTPCFFHGRFVRCCRAQASAPIVIVRVR